MNDALLQVASIYKQYVQGNAQVPVLNDINFVFKQGNSYAIMGISGSGKSTFMHILAGIDEPTKGHVFFNERDIVKMAPDVRSLFLNQHIGLVFQQPYLIPELTALENVMMPGLIADKDWNVCVEKAKILLDAVNLSDKAMNKPGTLSGGQQQRVAIARALFNEPSFLLADEPTGNLDLQTGKAIIDLIVALQAERHMGVIISTHDNYVADLMNHKVYLDQGTLIIKR
jgi:lipoprotein-releasing system ATP-binding protein